MKLLGLLCSFGKTALFLLTNVDIDLFLQSMIFLDFFLLKSQSCSCQLFVSLDLEVIIVVLDWVLTLKRPHLNLENVTAVIKFMTFVIVFLFLW